MFYDVPKSRVSFMAKTSLNLYSLGLKSVWTSLVFGDRIYEMKMVTKSGRQGIKTKRSFLLYFDPW